MLTFGFPKLWPVAEHPQAKTTGRRYDVRRLLQPKRDSGHVTHIQADHVKQRALFGPMAPPILIDADRAATKLVAAARRGQTSLRPQPRSTGVLEHPTPLANLLNREERKLTLTTRWLREVRQAAPRATRRVRDYRQTTVPGTSIAINVEHIATRILLVDRIAASEQHGDHRLNGGRAAHATMYLSQREPTMAGPKIDAEQFGMALDALTTINAAMFTMLSSREDREAILALLDRLRSSAEQKNASGLITAEIAALTAQHIRALTELAEARRPGEHEGTE